MPTTLLVGGARSGKSRIAERLATESRLPVLYVATGTAGDDEMASRIARHRRERPTAWTTVEETTNIESVVATADGSYVIIDCLTLWLSNMFETGVSDDRIVGAASGIAAALAGRSAGSVVVSNEVGMGIVPVGETTRRYRDLLGLVNQAFARHLDRTWFAVAGRVVVLEEPWTD